MIFLLERILLLLDLNKILLGRVIILVFLVKIGGENWLICLFLLLERGVINFWVIIFNFVFKFWLFLLIFSLFFKVVVWLIRVFNFICNFWICVCSLIFFFLVSLIRGFIVFWIDVGGIFEGRGKCFLGIWVLKLLRSFFVMGIFWEVEGDWNAIVIFSI